jgi:hypothetical protein
MSGKTGAHPNSKVSQTREDRLKAALKANLARRKAQNRLRKHGQQEKTAPDDTGQDKEA